MTIKSYKEIKKERWLKRRKELYNWIQRAEAVGIKPMDAKKPTRTKRALWEESIIKAEKRLKTIKNQS